MSTPLLAIFFLSGVAALVFEALWFRLAGLTLGNSVWSATLVLAAFMAGLSLGNGVVARFYHRVSNPLRLYAKLELAIGIGGLGAVALLPHITAGLAPLFASVAEAPWLLNTLRLGIAFVVLAIPATAMGATLPVITEALSRSTPNFAETLGKLYGWNTLGAMVGAIGAEALLVRYLGIASAGLFACMMNLAASAIAMRLAATCEPAGSGAQPPQRIAPTPRAYRYLAVGFLSGAAMLAHEVVCFRFLLLTRSGTSIVFASMLSAVLAGIGVGGIAASALARRDDRSHRWLRMVSALCAVLIVTAYAGFDLFTASQIRQSPTALQFVGYAVFLMAPVAVLSGIAFTMVARGVKEELGSSMRTAGMATLWNTVGSMVGSLCAGFVLLPMLGMERAFFALAALYCVTALIAPPAAPREVPDAAWIPRLAWSTVAAAGVCLVLFPFGLMERSYFTIVQRIVGNDTLVAARETLTETLRYYRRDAYGEPHFYRLVTNDHSMSATNIAGKRYMKLYVYLPIALRPATSDALLISFGVGSTAKALTDSAGLRHIDVVDISRDILELSDVVYPGSDNPLRDERVQVHIEDGRFFLNSTSRRYDLITSEPPPPKLAGVVNLYSEEYFRLVRAHLNPGGYATYWLPVYQLTPLDTLAIVKGFCNSFENCSLWSGSGLEWMLMGSNGVDGRVTADGFAAQWHDARVAPELAAVGFESPAQMGSLFIADASQLAAFTKFAAPLTDDRPGRLSSAPFDDTSRVPLYDRLLNEDERRTRFGESAYVRAIWPAELIAPTEGYFRFERLYKNLLLEYRYSRPGDPFLWEAIDDVLTHSELETLPLWMLGSDRDIAAIAARSSRDSPRLEFDRAVSATARRDFRGALEHMARYAGRARLDAADMSLLLYLLAKNGRVADANALIHSMEPARVAEMSEFVSWFEKNFAAGPADIDK